MMPDDRIPYRRWFPWLNLFRAPGLAFSLRQLTVGAGSILCLWIGHTLVERMAPDAEFPAEFSARQMPLGSETSGSGFAWPPSPHQVREAVRPWDDVVRPGVSLLARNQSSMQRLRWGGHFAWSLAVWTLFGLALCRLAARRFSRDDGCSLRKSLRFGLTRWTKGLTAPLLPLAAALVVMIPAMLAAWFGRIPWAGPALTIVASPVVMLCCLAAVYLLAAVAIGWPLMVAAIAADDCDGFGGLSRSCSQWTGRPWYFAGCLIVAAGVAAAVVVLASLLASGTLYLAGLVLEGTLGDSPARAVAGSSVQVLVMLAVKSFGASFFWTTLTIMYLVLRLSVDGMPPERVAPDDDERAKPDPFPVVGMPAMS